MLPRVSGPDLDLLAHSPGHDGAWHSLADHLEGTADRASRYAAPLGLGAEAYLLGLVHDAGKASPDWQARLRAAAGTRARVGLDHKAAAARLLLGVRCVLPLWMAAHGHHGGLDSPAAVLDALAMADGSSVAEDWFRARYPEALQTPLTQSVPGTPSTLEMLTRLLFSALVDADWLDTEAHARAEERDVPVSLSALWGRFAESLVALGRRPCTPGIRALRDGLRAAAVAQAERPPGIVALDAPTGSGKTMASLAFAFHHCAAHGKRRIVMAAPFCSILDQTAAAVEEAVGTDGVLRHYGDHDSRAADNWDAPIVVTSMVQLFESLFDFRPSRVRKLHRLADSVIILDEVQSLPEPLLVPILDALRTLVDAAGVTVLVTTATQPEWWHLSPFAGLPHATIEPDPALLPPPRVRYEWHPGRPALADIATEASREHRQALVVCNTTRDAAAVAASMPRALHLSARMCPEHRVRVLEEVTRRLDAGDSIHLVSTQVVEAGVDLDFPVAFRAAAHPAALQQVAGRVNRHGLRGTGRVVIFDPVDGGSPPGAYRTAASLMWDHFGPGVADPDDRAALAAFWRELFRVLNVDPARGGGAARTPAAAIQAARSRLDYREVSRLFALIEDETTPVVVRASEPRVAALVAAWAEATDAAARREALRGIAPYTVNLRPGEVDQRLKSGLIVKRPGVSEGAGVLLIHQGVYDPRLGITVRRARRERTPGVGDRVGGMGVLHASGDEGGAAVLSGDDT